MRKRLSAPIIVDLNITNRCNLQCGFCYANAKGSVEEELSYERIQSLFDEFQKMNVHIVRISGGEPFCHKEIRRVINLLNKYQFSPCINTNGTMLSVQEANLLAESKINHIAISLDSSNPIIHEQLRGIQGCFDRTCKAIELLLERCPEKIYITYTVTSLNCSKKEIIKMIQWCKSKKIRHLSFQITAPVGRCMERRDLIMSQKQWESLFCLLTKIKKRNNNLPEISIHPTNESPVFYQYFYPLKKCGMLDLLDSVWEQKLEEKTEFISCVGGNISVAINAKGDVYPCELMFGNQKCIVGNIKDSTFLEIWQNSLFFDKIYNKKKDDLEGKCSKCENAFCGGGCRAIALSETGNIWGSEKECPYVSK